MTGIKKILLIVFIGLMSIAMPVSADELTLQMANNYEFGRNGVRQDYQQAFTLYCQSAQKGDADAAYSLGFMYLNGRGRPHDLAVAVYWFTQAANKGDIQSQNILNRFKGTAPIEDGLCKPVKPAFNKIIETNPKKKQVAEWVNQIAPDYGIDPGLIMAVIQAESAFDTNALSVKNAQGLMQLIPETAERFGVKDSWNPEQNIRGGTAYLHWLLKHFDGRVDWVLAAYNAGEKAVERYNGVPPYQETQDYVKLIQGWYPLRTHPVPTEPIPKSAVIDQKS